MTTPADLPGRGAAEESSTELPPADPESWTDEQWITWLQVTDDPLAEQAVPVTRTGRAVVSAGGAVLGNAMMGLANALYGPKRDEVVIVEEAPGEPPTEDGYEVVLDPGHPERSRVVHHVLDQRDGPAEAGAGA